VLTVVTAAAGARWQPSPNSFGELDSFRSQIVHVPWIVQAGGCPARSVPLASRGSQLLSPRCLNGLMTWWFDQSDASWSDWLAANSAAQIITRTKSGAARVTTNEWAAIAVEGSRHAGLLFRKPEDYWEVNNLAAVLPETLAGFDQTLRSS
jgi:hypothetical protein